MNSDFAVENHGSIFLLRPISAAAHDWIEDHIGESNGYQPLYPTVAIEPRYVSDILEGIQNDGLAVQA